MIGKTRKAIPRKEVPTSETDERLKSLDRMARDLACRLGNLIRLVKDLSDRVENLEERSSSAVELDPPKEREPLFCPECERRYHNVSACRHMAAREVLRELWQWSHDFYHHMEDIRPAGGF